MSGVSGGGLKLVLIGDGESPHLLKWARALSALAPRVELWAASSRGFAPGFDALLPAERRLALGTRPDFAGGNVGLLRELPRHCDEVRFLDGEPGRPLWPMIILRTPKGWTGPHEVDGKQVEDTWRSHQVPLSETRTNPSHMAQLEIGRAHV